LSSLHAVTIELEGQLLAWDRELDSRKGAIVVWQEGLATFVHAWGGADRM
jgi:hypothetical protein